MTPLDDLCVSPSLLLAGSPLDLLGADCRLALCSRRFASRTVLASQLGPRAAAAMARPSCWVSRLAVWRSPVSRPAVRLRDVRGSEVIWNRRRCSAAGSIHAIFYNWDTEFPWKVFLFTGNLFRWINIQFVRLNLQNMCVRSLFTCSLTTICGRHLLSLLVLRTQVWSGTGPPQICLQGCWRWEGQRGDLVAAHPRGGPAAGVRAAVPAFPEPGFVGVLHHPPRQAVLQGVLVALGESLPFWIPELFHVLCTDFLGHHGSWRNKRRHTCRSLVTSSDHIRLHWKSRRIEAAYSLTTTELSRKRAVPPPTHFFSLPILFT